MKNLKFKSIYLPYLLTNNEIIIFSNDDTFKLDNENQRVSNIIDMLDGRLTKKEIVTKIMNILIV